MDLNQSNLEEAVIRRTVCVTGLGMNIGEQDIIESLGPFGEIQYVRVDLSSGGGDKVALVQYKEEKSAEDLVRQVQIRIRDHIARVRQSSITIEVIPPTDAVFGKPMTVGRHFMAVNISKENRGRDYKLSDKVRRSRDAILSVLERISVKSGWTIPVETIESLSAETGDQITGDKGADSSRTISRRSSRSRSRSSRGGHRRMEDRNRYHRRR